MGLIDKFKRTFVTPVMEEKEEGMAMARSLREAGAAALSHLEALYGLLKLELEEASKRLGQKMALLLLAAFMAFFGYLFVWCLLTMIMAYYWNIIAGLARDGRVPHFGCRHCSGHVQPHSRYSHRPRYGGRT